MFTGKQIFLRMLEREDLPLRVKWLNDPDIYQTLVSDYPVSLSRTEAWFNKTVMDSSKFHLSICDKETGRVIGMTGLLQINTRHRHAQFYITLGEKEFHGRRIPDEVIPLVLRYAFTELGLNKVYLWTIPCNKRGRHVYERNGFVQEAVMDEHFFCRGELQTLIQHRILKSEFAERGGLD